MRPTGPTNIELRLLISELKKEEAPIFTRIAKELGRPTRQRRSVNLSRIDSHTNSDEVAVVPGKVLGTGNLTKKLKVAGWQFSESAEKKIKEAGGSTITIKELIKSKPKGMRIIG